MSWDDAEGFAVSLPLLRSIGVVAHMVAAGDEAEGSPLAEALHALPVRPVQLSQARSSPGTFRGLSRLSGGCFGDFLPPKQARP